MAPKRSRIPHKPTYAEIQADVNSKRLLQERKFEPDRDVPFYLQIRGLNLQRLIQTRQPGNETFVRHFYASARFYSIRNISFRNRIIDSFSPQDFQRFFRLPDIQECQYKTIVAHPPLYPFDDILAALGNADAHWVQPHHGQSYLRRSDLNKNAKTWLHFITSNVAPTLHLSHVPQKTALLIYLLISEQPVKIEDIMMDSLSEAIHSKRKIQSLIFPHLISDFYRAARVPELDTDVKFQPMPVLKYDRVLDPPDRGLAEPHAPAASMEMEEDIPAEMEDEAGTSSITLTSLSQDIRRLEAKLERATRHQRKVDAYRRQMDTLLAQHMGFQLPPEPVESQSDEAEDVSPALPELDTDEELND